MTLRPRAIHRRGWCAAGLLAPVLAAVALLALAGRLPAQAVAVEGTDRVLATVGHGLTVTPYANAGYRLEIVGGTVRVTSAVEPLASTASFSLPVASPGATLPPRNLLARAVVAGASTRYEAVSRVLGWVSRNIEYTLDRTLAQDADAVLARRSGYCTGVARLTVALLADLGIEAREVAGYVLAGRRGGRVGFHRWIEVSYPDRGWVFSDPLAFHHYVPARYLRVAAEQVPDGPDPVTLVERQDQLVPVDIYPAAAPGVRARKNTSDQLAAALRVVVTSPDAPGTTVLEGRGLRLTRALEDGASTFTGLQPGDYTLRLLLPGKVPLEQHVQLPGRVRHAVVFRLHDPVGPQGTPPSSGAATTSLVGRRREETR